MFLITLLGMLTMLITLLLSIYHLASRTNKRKKIFYDLRHYFWDDPHLYEEGVDGIIRRCVPEHEHGQIIWKCHFEAYGGHHAGNRTAHKVLQSGFYWPTLFKDARKFVLSCDECQRICNIGKRQEMPISPCLFLLQCSSFSKLGPSFVSKTNVSNLGSIIFS